MALVRYEPWRGFGQVHNELNRVFSGFSNEQETNSATVDWVPAVDIQEYQDHFRLKVDLPGVEPDSVSITVDNGQLTIEGERGVDPAASDGEPLSQRTERRIGKFLRRFNLPETIDVDNVKATNTHGVLQIAIPKLGKAQPRRIEIAA